MPTSNQLTGGMVVSRGLQRYGVRTIFALAGAAYTHLLEALDDDGLTIISTRHARRCAHSVRSRRAERIDRNCQCVSRVLAGSRSNRTLAGSMV